MSRYRRDVEIHSPRLRGLRDVGTVGDVGSLRLRVHGNKVDAYVPVRSSYTAPPRFTGEVRGDRTDLVLTGRIKESLTSAGWTRVDLAVLALMLALVVIGIVDLATGQGRGGLAPLLIGIVGAAVFIALFAAHRRRRCIEWQLQSAALETELTDYVTQG